MDVPSIEQTFEEIVADLERAKDSVNQLAELITEIIKKGEEE